MKNIVTLALVAASLVAFPVATPAFAIDKSISPHCGPDAPESFRRPGGYCDQIGSNKSLNDGTECDYFYVSKIALKFDAEFQLAASPCDYYYLPWGPLPTST